MILILVFVENCLKYDANNFSVWLRTGSNTANIKAILDYKIERNSNDKKKVDKLMYIPNDETQN